MAPSNPRPNPDGREAGIEAPLYRDRDLYVIVSITLMAVMGVSSITPVFPAVVEAFGIPPEAVGLLITVYAFPGIFLTPVFGALADRIGRKQVLVPALILFALAGSACSLTRDFQTLLILRFFQGVGGASLGSLTATLIGDLYRDERRTEAMGYKASALSMGSAVYPSLGGGLAVFGWYAPFALPIVGLLVALAVLFRLDLEPTPNEGGLVTYLKEAWSGMKTRKVVGLYLATLLSFTVLYGAYMTFIPLYLGDRFGSSPMAIGPIMTIGSLTTALTASRLKALSRLLPQERLLPMAFLFFATSFIITPWLPGHWWVGVAVGIFGVGQALNYPVVLNLLAEAAPGSNRGIFMSTNGMVIRIGQAMGPVIMAGVFALGGMETVFYAACGISLLVGLMLPIFLGTGERPSS